MPEKLNCDISSNAAENSYSVCSKLSVVDDTKSDMEYKCFGCYDK